MVDLDVGLKELYPSYMVVGLPPWLLTREREHTHALCLPIFPPFCAPENGLWSQGSEFKVLWV